MIYVSNLKMSYKISTLILLLLSIDLQSQDIPASAMEILEQNPNLLDRLENDDFSQDFTNNEESLDFSVDELVPGAGPTKSNIFGMNYINSIPTSISATSDLPLSNDYVLTFGDKLKVIFTGSKKSIFTLQVNLDGTVLFPELGSVYVAGESFGDVKRKIRNMVDVSYVGVDVDLSVQSITARKINIIGAVNNPGTYLVNPFSTITSALAYSGGFVDHASLREIVLIRNNKNIIFDLYDLLIFGDRSADINIQQGDTILVNATNKFIKVEGEINRPMIYEYQESESIQDIINFSMGLTNEANPSKIAVIDYSNDYSSTKVSEFSVTDNPSMLSFNNPKNIEIFRINSSPKLKLKVTGPLNNQGYFEVPESGKLHDLVKNLNFTTEVNPFIAVIQNDNDSLLFSLNDISTQNIEISDNSEIYFFNKNETITNGLSDTNLTKKTLRLIEDYQLKIQINKEIISFPFYGNTNALQIIDYLGLDISGNYISQTTYISPLKDISIVGYPDQVKFSASKFNSLIFRGLSDKTVSVEISGEVNLPGTYFMKSGSSLKDLYALIDGVKASADENAIIFTRESIRKKDLQELQKANKMLLENIALNSGSEKDASFYNILELDIDQNSLGRVSGDLTLSSNLIEDFLLEDGDKLFIPKKINTVSVIGEVLSPTSFIFNDDITLNDSIGLAGGYTDLADKRKTYIIRSNGTIVRTPSGIFSGNIIIKPGDTIVVPLKLNTNDDFISILAPITSVLSNLAFSAAAIDNLRQ